VSDTIAATGKEMISIFLYGVRVRVMVFNATFNNISVILWRAVLLVDEIFFLLLIN
jgi:hypothetical protein